MSRYQPMRDKRSTSGRQWRCVDMLVTTDDPLYSVDGHPTIELPVKRVIDGVEKFTRTTAFATKRDVLEALARVFPHA
jgi:hypothetical protein